MVVPGCSSTASVVHSIKPLLLIDLATLVSSRSQHNGGEALGVRAPQPEPGGRLLRLLGLLLRGGMGGCRARAPRAGPCAW
jgi:hypothetical protein